MPTFNTLAIANRGEVAVRIIRACQDLGLKSVLLHSDVDKKSLAYRLADKCVCIGPAAAHESYLNIQANIKAALKAGAGAVHPGFGFLSENAKFAKACADAGLIFVGPSPEHIQLFGDKIAAKSYVTKLGVPLLPSIDEALGAQECVKKMKSMGFPVMIKAAGGGGGRGLRVVSSAEQAGEALAAAQREGQAAFHSDRVFVEKYLDHAQHIEVQMFGTHRGKAVCWGERECSIQFRHQKIIEQAPSLLSPETRAALHQAATQIVQSAGYKGAGTVEFLWQDNKFYFLEVNTRLQVEHGVTEMVYDVDLVKAQILTAQGEELKLDVDPLHARGFAIECRVYAQNSESFLPSTGPLLGCYWPQGPGRRFDVGFETGDEVTAFYDAMLAKVLVHDSTHQQATQKMLSTLAETVVLGVESNLPLLQKILQHPQFAGQNINTQFMAQNFAPCKPPAADAELARCIIQNMQGSAHSQGDAAPRGHTENKSPWLHNWG